MALQKRLRRKYVFMNGIVIEGKDIHFQGEKVYHTDLKILLKASGVDPEKYNWMIYQYECNYYPFELLEERRHDHIWLSGLEVSEMLENKHLQFIWGIIVAFKPDICEKSVLENGIPDYNENNYSNQLNEIEIFAIDSTLTKLFANDKKIIEQLQLSFPMAKII